MHLQNNTMTKYTARVNVEVMFQLWRSFSVLRVSQVQSQTVISVRGIEMHRKTQTLPSLRSDQKRRINELENTNPHKNRTCQRAGPVFAAFLRRPGEPRPPSALLGGQSVLHDVPLIAQWPMNGADKVLGQSVSRLDFICFNNAC